MPETDEFQKIFDDSIAARKATEEEATPEKLKLRAEEDMPPKSKRCQPVFGRRSSMPDLSSTTPALSLSRPGPVQQQDKHQSGKGSGDNKESTTLAAMWQHESPDLTLDAVISLEQPTMELQDLKKLLGRLKMKLSSSHAETLERQMFELTGDCHGSLDFANFLRTMRWMMDTNFAHLSELTAAVAKTA